MYREAFWRIGSGRKVGGIRERGYASKSKLVRRAVRRSNGVGCKLVHMVKFEIEARVPGKLTSLRLSQ
jgi:hypothetical protein